MVFKMVWWEECSYEKQNLPKNHEYFARHFVTLTWVGILRRN